MDHANIKKPSSILVLIFFFLTNFLVIFSPRIRVPHFISSSATRLLVKCRILDHQTRLPRPVYIPIDFRTAPLASVLILLAARGITGTDIQRGILGSDGVKPISVMALFISLAYISISLDATGLFRCLAFWVARKGGSSGQKLYAYLYIFFMVCGVIVGNDPVILSGTAFLAYLTRISGITPPTAWIFSQFAAANMASSVLVSSNPTNLVVSGAFSISFIKYSAHIILPFLAAAVLVYPVLVFVLFRSTRLIPPSIHLDLDHPEASGDLRSTLVDKNGARFGSVLMVATLCVLVGTSTIGVPVWEVTVPPALIMLGRDICHDWFRFRAMKHSCSSNLESIEMDVAKTDDDDEPAEERTHTISLESLVSRYAHRLYSTFPTVCTICQRLPLSLLPFVFLMFILVQGLAVNGWVEVFAHWWTAWVNRTGSIGAAGGMGFIACVLCNICGTNIGTTILLSRVLQLWIASSQPSSRTQDCAKYALALGTNYGAVTISFSASLAGMLWRDILRQKGIHVRAGQFARLNFPIVFVAMLASLGVLVGEIYYIHRNDNS